jgi:uncharacterized protein YjbI with pentapeptide repeats
VPGQDPAQELQVRQTVQRILAAHLQLPGATSSTKAQRRPPSSRRAFWPGISVDLTGATLIDFDFMDVSVLQARFNEATFHGDAWFLRSAFQGDVSFNEATFQGPGVFESAAFQGGVWFFWATFHDLAQFVDVTFQGNASFVGTTFQGHARFNRATFRDHASFHGATFTRGNEVKGVAGARVLHLDDPGLNRRRKWPDGSTVRPDPADPTRGTLVPTEQAEKPEPAVPSSDPTDGGSGTG